MSHSPPTSLFTSASATLRPSQLIHLNQSNLPVTQSAKTTASVLNSNVVNTNGAAAGGACLNMGRRELALSLSSLLVLTSSVPAPAWASSDEEYVKDTSEVITKVRSTIGMDKSDPNVATAVAELRDASNSWVAKYRREKALLGRASFRDIYSALNAVSGHYISFGPTAPIPAKRKARILEEVDTAEKALRRGR